LTPLKSRRTVPLRWQDEERLEFSRSKNEYNADIQERQLCRKANDGIKRIFWSHKEVNNADAEQLRMKKKEIF
jgi:hypothetical protein